MSDIFDKAYYLRLYEMNLLSIIGKCQCLTFDPVNSSVSDRLYEITAFIERNGIANHSYYKKLESDRIMHLYKKAVCAYCDRFRVQNGFGPGSECEYREIIFEYSKEEEEN